MIQAIRGGFKGRWDSLLWIVGCENVAIRVGEVPLAVTQQVNASSSRSMGHSSIRAASTASIRPPPRKPAILVMWKHDYWDFPQGAPTPDCTQPAAQHCSYNRSEWRHGVRIGTEWVPGEYGPSVCKNITISGGDHGLSIVRSGGDGIIVTGCNNTHIQNVQALENNRQGLSIINAQDMVVEDSEFSRTNGTAPAAGIDVEPDYAEYSLVNITLRRLLLENNDGHGLQVALREWARHPEAVLAPISLTMESVVARGSFSPTSVSHGFQLTMVEDAGLDTSGSIVMTNCRAEYTNLAGLQLGDVSIHSARVTIVDMTIVNAAQAGRRMGAQYTGDLNSPVDLGWLGWELAANATQPPCGGGGVPQNCGGATLTNLHVADNINRPWLQLASMHYNNSTSNLRGSVVVTNPFGCTINSTAGPLDPLPNLLTTCKSKNHRENATGD